tara:strand:+ start:249 stop:392 length:144 start_codon:yes stop_codon:yes gene_type:complete
MVDGAATSFAAGIQSIHPIHALKSWRAGLLHGTEKAWAVPIRIDREN